MSTIHLDASVKIVPPVPPGARSTASATRNLTRTDGTPDAAAGGAATDGDAQAPVPPVTGKVYALKDGSGYVALASDGHYYKLETTGNGLVYAAAAGAVDASVVDVSRGPVRSLRAPAARSPASAHAGAAAAQGAHGLVAGDPATALRAHARVSRRSVASLLR